MLNIGNHLVYTDDDRYTMCNHTVHQLMCDSNAFKKIFCNYLQVEYGITEEKFREIIKNLAPEEFI